MSVCIPCAILLLRKPHDNNESIEFLTQIRQTKHRTNRTENQHERATNRILAPKFRACADVIQLCPAGTFSFTEAALLLVSTKNRDLWLKPLAESNTGSPRFTDFPSLCACSESSLTNLIGSGLNLLYLQSHSKTECRWTRPEVAILGADQKEHGLWGRECGWMQPAYMRSVSFLGKFTSGRISASRSDLLKLPIISQRTGISHKRSSCHIQTLHV